MTDAICPTCGRPTQARPISADTFLHGADLATYGLGPTSTTADVERALEDAIDALDAPLAEGAEGAILATVRGWRDRARDDLAYATSIHGLARRGAWDALRTSLAHALEERLTAASDHAWEAKQHGDPETSSAWEHVEHFAICEHRIREERGAASAKQARPDPNPSPLRSDLWLAVIVHDYESYLFAEPTREAAFARCAEHMAELGAWEEDLLTAEDRLGRSIAPDSPDWWSAAQDTIAPSDTTAMDILRVDPVTLNVLKP